MFHLHKENPELGKPFLPGALCMEAMLKREQFSAELLEEDGKHCKTL